MARVLAVDGVVVHDADPTTIRGDAEQDPPGGWEPFTVSAPDGRAVVGSKPPMLAIGKPTDEEVRQILERAVRSKTDRGVSYAKLLAIGVSRESIDAAVHQLQLGPCPDFPRAIRALARVVRRLRRSVLQTVMSILGHR